MRLRFTKMHGLGNDFIVIDAINQKVSLSTEKIQALADRRFGIGCDQILLVEPPSSPAIDFRYRIFNSDGSEVENCGNGARCFARFVRDRKLTGKSRIAVETCNGEMLLMVEDNGDITVDMGTPLFAPAQIPFDAATQQSLYPLPLGNDIHHASVLSMGNPHAVLVVEDVATAPVLTLGPQIESLTLFPNKVNVGFMAIRSRHHIDLRVYERGSGETLACGTGACAAVVAGQQQDLLDSVVNVNLPGGRLSIRWEGANTPVMMTGPATHVFQGQVKL